MCIISRRRHAGWSQERAATQVQRLDSLHLLIKHVMMTYALLTISIFNYKMKETKSNANYLARLLALCIICLRKRN